MDNDQQSAPVTLAEALRIARRRAPLIVVCAVAVAVAAYAFSKSQAKEYTATAALAFTDNPLSEQIVGLPPAPSSNLLAQNASNVESVVLGDTAARTARKLGITEHQVRQSVGVAGKGESNVVTVSATAASPKLAAALATTYSRQFVRLQRHANDRFFETALRLVKRQIHELPANERFGQTAVALQNRAQSLKLLKELRYGNVSVAQAAFVPLVPSSPKVSRNTVVGAILGLLLGAGIAFALERFRRERRLMNAADLEATYAATLLGTVDDDAEAFDMAHARLGVTHPRLRTVLVTAAARGEGARSVALGLAEAAARMGSRVLLLEADLREPTLAARLGVDSGPGLQHVLDGTRPVGGAIRAAGVRAPGGGPVWVLDVLAGAAAPVPNPAQLVGGASMKELLAHLASTYDLVVVDAPPVTVVSDALPLLREVDGVVLVARIGRCERDAAVRLRSSLERAAAPLAGVIAYGGSGAAGHGSGTRATPLDSTVADRRVAPLAAPES